MGREFELKYAADAAKQDRIREVFPGQWRIYTMETTYFDTPDGDIAARRWTLRRRMENGIPVCTVKTPAPGGARGEWELECGDIREAIPGLCKLGCPGELETLATRGLTAICGAKFTRHATVLTLEDCAVELALDRGLLSGGSKTLPLCEVEVELKSGSEDAALAFAEELAAKFDLSPEPRSKYRRALDLTRE